MTGRKASEVPGHLQEGEGKGQTYFGGNDFRPTLFTFIQEIFFETLLIYHTL